MNKYLKIFLQLLAILSVAAFSIWVLNFFVPKNQSGEVATEVANQIKEIILKRPTCDNTSIEFKDLKNQGSYISILSDIDNIYGIAGDGFVNDKNITLVRSGTGSEIACGYLYVSMGVGNKKLATYENIYISPGDFGGHLQNNAAIVDQSNSTSTQLIFALDNITYKQGKKSSDIFKANWSALLNAADKIIIGIALNTTNPNGVIHEIGIAYKCWNPTTGEITTDCKLQIESKK